MTALILSLGLLAAPTSADWPVPCRTVDGSGWNAVPAAPPNCAPVSAPAKDDRPAPGLVIGPAAS